jgi:hypothetical protein
LALRPLDHRIRNKRSAVSQEEKHVGRGVWLSRLAYGLLGISGPLATIDLSTVDQTGCRLTYNYASGETTLKWDSEDPPGPDMCTTADDVQVAVEDITRGQLDHRELFEAFQDQMIAGISTAS